MSAARHLRIAPGPEELLRHEIAGICDQIDRRLNNPPGTAERGVYFWQWPPENVCEPAVLSRLHVDAVTFLCRIVTDPNPQKERNPPDVR